MTETITINAVDRSSVVPRASCEWAGSAYLGEVASGRLTIHDTTGDISVPAYKDVTCEQDAASAATIFKGFAHNKTIRRGESAQVGASREIELEIRDGNDLLQRHVIRKHTGGTLAAGGKRPAETVGDRITWLLASGFLDAEDFGAVSYPTDDMDANDYRGQFAGDVLSACAKAADSFNYYIRWNEAEAAWELVFRNDNTSTADTSTISISNVASETNGTTVFAPSQDAELAQDAEHVYSGVFYVRATGHGYTSRASTVTAFADRDGITEDTGTKTKVIADRDAESFLWQSRNEEQTVTLTLRMRAAYVNDILPGQRVWTKLTHMDPEGWADGRWARVLRRKVTQPLDTDNDYDVRLELSPQEAGCSDAPSTVQYIYTEGVQDTVTPQLDEWIVTPSAATTAGNLLVAVVASPRGVANSHLLALTLDQWNIAVNDESEFADGVSGNHIYVLWRVSAAEDEFRFRFGTQNGGRRFLLYEIAGLTTPSLYDNVQNQEDANPGYATCPATDYPAGPAAVLEFTICTGPTSGDTLTTEGTGFSPLYTITAGGLVGAAIGAGYQYRTTASTAGTTPVYPAAGGWRFLFTFDDPSITFGLTFVGENCA